MKIQFTPVKSMFNLLAAMILFASCSKKNDIIPPVNPGNPVVTKIQFAADQDEIIEKYNEREIEILLHPKPSRAGVISISVEENNAVHLRDYVTIPGMETGKITVPFEAGAEKVSFRLKSGDDDIYNQERKVKFTLEEIAGSNLKPEGKILATVKIVDDERHSNIRFEESLASVYEHEQAGYDVKFLLEPAAKEDGYIDISLHGTDAIYGTHYTTNPASFQGKLRVRVKAGDESVSFKVIPIRNFTSDPSRIIKFKIIHATEQLRPDYLKELELFILDNGQSNGLTIRTIRDAYKGKELTFVFPTTISGRVISKNDNVSPKIAFIQDATGGIAVEFTGNNTLPMGEMVTIDIEGGLVSEINDILTIRQIPNTHVERGGVELWVIPEMTLEQINNRPKELEGQVVTLKNITIAGADGSKVLEGIHYLHSNNYEARILVNSFSSFRNNIIPTGTVSVTGILIWNRNGYYTILPQRAQDIR